MGPTRTLLSAFTILAVMGGVGVSSLGLALVRREAATLPDVATLLAQPTAAASRMLANDGSVMARFAAENRTPVVLSAVPPIVVRAFLSAEDRSFWRHTGVDPAAVIRASLANIRARGSGRRLLGASTITQQVVKNALGDDEVSLRRKLREALLALRLERAVGKQQVLQTYLNAIYLGQGAYGVAAAADAWFGKPLDALSLAEVAFLAGLPKGPSNYDPAHRPAAALARRRYVLDRMVDDGVVGAAEAATAAAAPLPHPSMRRLGGPADDWFSEAARREVVARLGAGALYRGGLEVRTSMDPALQTLAEHALREGLSEYDRRHGWRGPLTTLRPGSYASPAAWQAALGAIEPPAGAEEWQMAVVLGFDASGATVLGLGDGSSARLGFDGMRWARRDTGRGLAASPRRPADVVRPGDVVLVARGASNALELRQIPVVDGALVAMEARTGRVLALAGGFSHERGSFDRATQAMRQPGSSFKPFVYLSAFEHGYDQTSPVLDTPIAIDPGDGAPRWRPGADGGAGWGLITTRRALENSRNLAAVRLLYDLGLDTVGDVARRFGLYDRLPTFAAALGALEVTDLRLTAAYAMLANGGHAVTPTLVDAVEDAAGGTLLQRPTASGAVVADPVAVAQLVSVLQGVVKRGTAASSLGRLNLPIAGKTGTTNDNVDAWFVGFTPDLAVGVHVGYDQPEPLGDTEFGGRAAAPIFGSFVQSALTLHPPSAAGFPVPPGTRLERVDPVTGEASKTGTEEILRATP